MTLKNIFLTIDFESLFLIENFKNIDTSSYQTKNRLSFQLDQILNFLKKNDILSTFFVLKKDAAKNPHLIRKIHSYGHEIASHGSSHKLLYELSVSSMDSDIFDSKRFLEDTIQSEIYGYRAPCFSFREKLIPILEKYKFRYDSSYNCSSFNNRYSSHKFNNFSFDPFLIENSNIVEFPLSNIILYKNLNFPISGGGMGRLTPRKIWFYLCKKYLKDNKNLIFYLHPWEIDNQLPIIFSSPKKMFATYYNTSNFLNKFQFLIDNLNAKYNTNWMRMKEFEI